jgi:hypothetical protein
VTWFELLGFVRFDLLALHFQALGFCDGQIKLHEQKLALRHD